MEQAGTNCIMSFSRLFEIKVLQIYISVPLSWLHSLAEKKRR